MRNGLVADTATRHRIAAVFALAFVAAAITALGAVFALDVRAGGFAPTITPDYLPDATWPAVWLPGAVSAAEQQRAAAAHWLRLILLFGGLAAVVAFVNALIGLVSHANERRYE